MTPVGVREMIFLNKYKLGNLRIGLLEDRLFHATGPAHLIENRR